MARAKNINTLVNTVVRLTKEFYRLHTEIKISHGWAHVDKVYTHTCKALLACDDDNKSSTSMSPTTAMEIQMAALLHDVDDSKYFPSIPHGSFPNAQHILNASSVGDDSQRNICQMISWVGCSENGNSIPSHVSKTKDYHLLIPRWADRLEAVGARGVIRCYQYNQEHKQSFFLPGISPRPQNETELWRLVTPDKLQAYMDRGGSSTDMISHYYDKLLHLARPPPDLVRNSYLEQMAVTSSSKELVEVCLRFGKTGEIDHDYIRSLETED